MLSLTVCTTDMHGVEPNMGTSSSPPPPPGFRPEYTSGSGNQGSSPPSPGFKPEYTGNTAHSNSNNNNSGNTGGQGQGGIGGFWTGSIGSCSDRLCGITYVLCVAGATAGGILGYLFGNR